MAEKKAINFATKFELTIPEAVPEVYVDGVSGVITGWPISKLVFHSVQPSNESTPAGTENRRAVLTMSLPTLVLIELSRNVLASYAATREQVNQVANIYSERIDALLADVEGVSASNLGEAPAPAKGKK